MDAMACRRQASRETLALVYVGKATWTGSVGNVGASRNFRRDDTCEMNPASRDDSTSIAGSMVHS